MPRASLAPLDSPMGRCLSGPIVLSALSTIWDVYLNMIFVEWQMIKLEHGNIKWQRLLDKGRRIKTLNLH